MATAIVDGAAGCAKVAAGPTRAVRLHISLHVSTAIVGERIQRRSSSPTRSGQGHGQDECCLPHHELFLALPWSPPEAKPSQKENRNEGPRFFSGWLPTKRTALLEEAK
jgi:hypothetical protein